MLVLVNIERPIVAQTKERQSVLTDKAEGEAEDDEEHDDEVSDEMADAASD